MSPRKPPKSKKRSGTNTLRIIGGEWRSRKLPFIDAQGLRPTPDRIRETLFNWLQGSIHGANCLDLFAGSGVLGFEALSRGAKQVVFVEKNKSVVDQLKTNLHLLKTDADVFHNDALEYLVKLHHNNQDVFDIIFLDPPYRQGLLEKVLKILDDKEKPLIDKNTLLYIEHEAEEHFNWNELGLTILKQANAGQVKCYLARVI